MGCKYPDKKKGCLLRQPCVKQASNNAHFVSTAGETTSASESESNSKHRYPTRLSMSDNESAIDQTSIAIEAVSNMVSNLDRITLTDFEDITSRVSTGASGTPVGGCSEVDSLDQTLVETSVLPKQANVLPHYQSTWEVSQVPDHNFSQIPPMRPILRNPRRESNIHVPLNAISTPTKNGQSVRFTPPALGTIQEQSSHDNSNPDGSKFRKVISSTVINQDISSRRSSVDDVLSEAKEEQERVKQLQIQMDRQLQLSLQPSPPASIEDIQNNPELLATVRNIFTEFLNQVHPDHIGGFERELNHINLTSEEQVEQVFDMIIRKVYNLDSTVDIKREVQMYCDLLSKCFDMVKEGMDWNHPDITVPIRHLRNQVNQMAIDRLDRRHKAIADAEELQRKNWLAFSQCSQPSTGAIQWKNNASSRLSSVDDVLTEVELSKGPPNAIPSLQIGVKTENIVKKDVHNSKKSKRQDLLIQLNESIDLEESDAESESVLNMTPIRVESVVSPTQSNPVQQNMPVGSGSASNSIQPKTLEPNLDTLRVLTEELDSLEFFVNQFIVPVFYSEIKYLDLVDLMKNSTHCNQQLLRITTAFNKIGFTGESVRQNKLAKILEEHTRQLNERLAFLKANNGVPSSSVTQSNFVQQNMPVGSRSALNSAKPFKICPDRPVFSTIDPCSTPVVGRKVTQQSKDQTVQTVGLAGQILQNGVATSTTATNTVTRNSPALNSVSEILGSSANFQNMSKLNNPSSKRHYQGLEKKLNGANFKALITNSYDMELSLSSSGSLFNQSITDSQGSNVPPYEPSNNQYIPPPNPPDPNGGPNGPGGSGGPNLLASIDDDQGNPLLEAEVRTDFTPLDNSMDMSDSDFEFHLSLDRLPREVPSHDESIYMPVSDFDINCANVASLVGTETVFSKVREFPRTQTSPNEVQIGSVLNSSSIVQNVPISTSCDLNKAKPNIQEESYRQTKPSRTRSDKPILGAGNFRSTFAIGQSVSRQSRKQAPKSGLVKQFLPESAITSSLTASDNEYQTFHTQQIDLENRSENNCVLSFDGSDGSETTFFPTTCVDDNMSPTTIPKTFLKQLISNINGLNSSEGSTVAPIGATSIPSTEQILSEGSTAAPVGATSIPSTKINLQKCKESGKIRAYSTCEVERAAIDDSTFIGYEEKTATVKSPFLDDPVKWGTIDNYKQADLALLAQLRKVEAEKCSMCSLMDLPKELQNRTRIVPARDYLTWQPTWNASSITTPCRLVVDPSMSVNTLQQLLELNLSFKGWLPVEAFDISKMYNQLFLHPEHYQPQLMLFMRVGIGCHPNNF